MKSGETAQQGCTFARDAIAFCGRLVRAKDSLENLKRGLQDVRAIAETAHEGSKAMNSKFKRVRTELFKVRLDQFFIMLTVEVDHLAVQITKDIPSNMARVTSEQRPSSQSDDDEPAFAIVGESPFAAVSVSSDDHIFFILPIDIQSDEEALREALTQFKRATEDLNRLIVHVGCFVNWWGDMKSSLAYLEEVLPQIVVDGSNPFRTDTVKERWTSVLQKYMTYQNQVGQPLSHSRETIQRPNYI